MDNIPIIDFHVHAGKFNLLRDDIQGLLLKHQLEDGYNVSDIFSKPEMMYNYLIPNNLCKAVIIAECGPGTNFSIDSKMIVDFTKENDFFIPFGNINPNFHDPIKEFEHSIELGVKGFKFYPADHSFNPIIKKMMYVYAECEKLKLPIMFHTGLTAQRDTEQKYIKPDDFSLIVKAYPDLTVILAHAGKPHWYEDACRLAIENPNVYLDTALVKIEDVMKLLEYHSKIANKLLLGSDWPVVGGYSFFIQKYKESSISKENIKKIFFQNAANILKLNKIFRSEQDNYELMRTV